MNVAPSHPRRVSRLSDAGGGRLGLIFSLAGVFALLVALLGVVPASAAPVGGAAGTVKVDGDDLAGGGNAPHRLCEINLEWDSFPNGDYVSTVFFDEQGGGGALTPVTSTPASGHNVPPGSETFTINNNTYSQKYFIDPGALTLTKQGYHLKISVDVAPVGGAAVYSKSKVLYALACDVGLSVDKTNDADGDTTFTDSESATAPGSTVPFRVEITNASAQAVVVDTITDKTTGAPFDVTALAGSTCTTPQTIASGGSYVCTFSQTNYGPAVGGASVVDTVEASGHSSLAPGVTGKASDTSTVTAPAPVQVTAGPKPTIVASSCVANAPVPSYYIVPTTPNVTYSVTGVGTVLSGSKRSGSAPTKETLTAAADAGYALSAAFSEVMSFGPLATNCAPVVNTPTASAAAPSVTQSTCSNGSATTPSFTVPTTTGVVYTPATGGPGVAGTSSTVTAVAAPGYVLTGPASFPVVFDAAPNCTVAPAPSEDLGLSKTGPGTAKPGDVLTYTLRVTNIQGTPATGFVVGDTLPQGLTPLTVDGSGFQCSIKGQAISCLYGPSLNVGDSASVTITALLDGSYQPAQVTNSAVVDPGRADVDPGNDTDSATTVVDHTLPFTGGGGGGATTPPPAQGGGIGLPFTGSYTQQLFQAGVGMLLLGLFLSLLARRRRTEFP